MSILSSVKSGAQHSRPIKALIYSEPKCGKTHLVAGAPGVIFADCERGALGYDVPRLEVTHYSQIVELVGELTRGDHSYKTLAIDTLDSLERLLAEDLLGAKFDRAEGLGEVSFGKGWAAAEGRLTKLTGALDALQRQRGMNVVILAHAAKGQDSDPDDEAAWSEWLLRVNKRTSQLFRGWVEDLLFLRDLRTVHRKKRLGNWQGIAIETRRSAAWDAGSRRIRVDQIRVPWAEPAQAWKALAKAYRAGVPAQPQPEPKAEEATS